MYGPPAGFYRNDPRVSIDVRFCVGCMKCLQACPSPGTLTVARDGQVRVAVADRERCVGCAHCVRACPTHAATMYLAP